MILLLKSIKASVTQIHLFSALHYLNGGQAAVTHLRLIINAVLDDIENFALDELNKVYAILLHKGNGKDKNSAHPQLNDYHFLSFCCQVC